ncbi:MAG: cadherin repeat domain-containing protein [Planctomycetaceae bacterium]|nr:cadherin repeat domain-containing protein [Planctomycetaceae bacterium]
MDPDAGQTLTYSITGSNTSNAFAINAATGQLTVSSSAAINFDVNPTFNLQITVTDNGTPQQSRAATAVVHLLDVVEAGSLKFKPKLDAVRPRPATDRGVGGQQLMQLATPVAAPAVKPTEDYRFRLTEPWLSFSLFDPQQSTDSPAEA